MLGEKPSQFVYFVISLRKPAKKGVWPEEEVEQLRTLYEEYKNSEEGNNSCEGTGVPLVTTPVTVKLERSFSTIH